MAYIISDIRQAGNLTVKCMPVQLLLNNFV